MPSTREAAINLCLTLTPKLEGGPFLTAIADPVRGWSTPTIGYGHTGPEVHQGSTITLDTADYLLRSDLNTAANELEKCVPSAQLDTILDNHERTALVDFCFNLGANPSWQIWKLLRAGNVNAAGVPIADRQLAASVRVGSQPAAFQLRREGQTQADGRLAR